MITGIAVPANDRLQRTVMDEVPRRVRLCATLNPDVITATGVALYTALSTHSLRRRGLWSAKDKAIPRELLRVDSHFAKAFENAFEALFSEGDSTEGFRASARR